MFHEIPSVSYRTKIIITDTVIQFYNYEKQIYKTKTGKMDYQKSQFGEKQEYSIQRAKSNLFLSVASNITTYSKFITLTTREAILERTVILDMFNQFRKNFLRVFSYRLKYVGVLERQKKRGIKENNEGSWHIHLIVFNNAKLDFKKLKQSWSYGSIDVKRLKHHTHIPVYLMKYLTKETIGINKKSILKSQHLKKPEIHYHNGDIMPNIDAQTYHDWYRLPDDSVVHFYENKINRIAHLENTYVEPFIFD